MVDSILPLKHNGKLTIRMSMNPEEIIKKVDVHTKINEEAFSTAINLYNRQIMTGRGKGKYSINFNIPILEHILLHVLLILECIHFQCLNHINSFQFLHILLA